MCMHFYDVTDASAPLVKLMKTLNVVPGEGYVSPDVPRSSAGAQHTPKPPTQHSPATGRDEQSKDLNQGEDEPAIVKEGHEGQDRTKEVQKQSLSETQKTGKKDGQTKGSQGKAVREKPWDVKDDAGYKHEFHKGSSKPTKVLQPRQPEYTTKSRDKDAKDEQSAAVKGAAKSDAKPTRRESLKPGQNVGKSLKSDSQRRSLESKKSSHERVKSDGSNQKPPGAARGSVEELKSSGQQETAVKAKEGVTSRKSSQPDTQVDKLKKTQPGSKDKLGMK